MARHVYMVLCTLGLILVNVRIIWVYRSTKYKTG